jgi:succinate-acetate transporter protein
MASLGNNMKFIGNMMMIAGAAIVLGAGLVAVVTGKVKMKNDKTMSPTAARIFGGAAVVLAIVMFLFVIYPKLK